jgi:hypothetical protein
MPDIKSLYQNLRKEIAKIKVIDTHEHLLSERLRQEEPESPFGLGYVNCDLKDIFGIENLDEQSFGLLWEKIKTGISHGSYENGWN